MVEEIQKLAKPIEELFWSILGQCYSNAGTRPGTGTWGSSYRDLNYFLKLHNLQNLTLIR